MSAWKGWRSTFNSFLFVEGKQQSAYCCLGGSQKCGWNTCSTRSKGQPSVKGQSKDPSLVTSSMQFSSCNIKNVIIERHRTSLNDQLRIVIHIQSVQYSFIQYSLFSILSTMVFYLLVIIIPMRRSCEVARNVFWILLLRVQRLHRLDSLRFTWQRKKTTLKLLNIYWTTELINI